MQQVFIKLEDYNTATKKVVLIIYAPESLEKFNLSFLLYFTLGEVNYKKHIKEVYYRPLPKSTNGLLLLSELPEYIDFLAKINYNRKLKIFLE